MGANGGGDEGGGNKGGGGNDGGVTTGLWKLGGDVLGVANEGGGAQHPQMPAQRLTMS